MSMERGLWLEPCRLGRPVTFSAGLSLLCSAAALYRGVGEGGSADFNPAVHILYKNINVERLKH